MNNSRPIRDQKVAYTGSLSTKSIFETTRAGGYVREPDNVREGNRPLLQPGSIFSNAPRCSISSCLLLLAEVVLVQIVLFLSVLLGQEGEVSEPRWVW
jgi:hypothetical protein